MIYDILESKLAGKGLVPGLTLFRGTMDADVATGVMIRTPLAGIKIDPFIEGWHKTELQVITRHTDPVEGMILANEVCKALLVETPEFYPASPERGPAHINVFYPDTLPIQYPRLAGNGLEFSQHFKAVFGFKPNWRA